MTDIMHSIRPYLDRCNHDSFYHFIEDFESIFNLVTKYSDSNQFKFEIKYLNINKKGNIISDKNIDFIQDKFFLKLLYSKDDIIIHKKEIEEFYLKYFSNKNYLLNVNKSSPTIYFTTLVAIILNSDLIFNDIIPYYTKDKERLYLPYFFIFFIHEHESKFIFLQNYITQTQKGRFLFNLVQNKELEIIKFASNSNVYLLFNELLEKQKDYWLMHDNIKNF